MIHDIQMDYYGKRIATASSDKAIKIFDIAGTQQVLVSELRGHDGPVWQVAWGHPKFGNLLASCSYDRKVIVWKEEDNGSWSRIYDSIVGESSINSVSWAPHIYGLVLAVASSDSYITVITYHQDTNQWSNERFLGHGGGVNSVSWAPGVASASLLPPTTVAPLQPFPRFVSGGCDNTVRIWRQTEQGKWIDERCFPSDDNIHKDWVRDVAWAPAIGLPSNILASCSEDGNVFIFTEDIKGNWKKSATLPIENTKVWRLSWSVMGNILAVTQGDNKVSLWKESLDGSWKSLSSLSEADVDIAPQK